MQERDRGNWASDDLQRATNLKEVQALMQSEEHP